MKLLAKTVLCSLGLAIVLFGTGVRAAQNGCYCSGTGKVADEVDVSNLKGFVPVKTEPECQSFSATVNGVSGKPSYYYCSWYQDGARKTSWKNGVKADLTEKNGCYCKSNGVEKELLFNYDNCSEVMANPSVEYSSCTWYEKNQAQKTYTKENVGSCVPVSEGNYCSNFDALDCATQNNESPCALVNGKCVLAVNAVAYCGKFAIANCKSYQGMCTWQTVGTDVNKPGEEPGVDVPIKTGGTFDASGLNKLGTTDVKAFAGRLIRGVMGILGSIALVMFVYSGILFMTDRGSGENVGKAKEIAVWTSLGLALIFASYAIINFILQIFGK